MKDRRIYFSPAEPTNAAATVISSSSINISWQDASIDEEGFAIERSSNNGSTWVLAHIAQINQTSYFDTGLSANINYRYRLYALHSTGNSTFVEVQAATFALPLAPTSLSAVSISASIIALNWQDASIDEEGFAIERSLANGGSWSGITNVSRNVINYNDTGLIASTHYLYLVYAFNSSSGISSYSNIANSTTLAAAAVPSAPSGLNVFLTPPATLNFSWSDNSNNEEGFTLEYFNESIWRFLLSTQENKTSITFNQFGLNSTIFYSFRVFAFNASIGNSSASNIIQATALAPLSPLILNARAISSSSIILNWTDSSSNEEGFNIEWSSNGTSGWLLSHRASQGSISYTDTDLEAGRTYYYRVQAYNLVGNSSYSPVANATTLIENASLAAPSNLRANASSSSSILLSWTDSSSNEEGFSIERSQGGTTNWVNVDGVGADVVSYEDIGLLSNTVYYYRVKSFIANTDSSFSNIASARTRISGIIGTSNTGTAGQSVDVSNGTSTTDLSTGVSERINATAPEILEGQVRRGKILFIGIMIVILAVLCVLLYLAWYLWHPHEQESVWGHAQPINRTVM